MHLAVTPNNKKKQFNCYDNYTAVRTSSDKHRIQPITEQYVESTNYYHIEESQLPFTTRITFNIRMMHKHYVDVKQLQERIEQQCTWLRELTIVNSNQYTATKYFLSKQDICQLKLLILKLTFIQETLLPVNTVFKCISSYLTNIGDNLQYLTIQFPKCVFPMNGKKVRLNDKPHPKLEQLISFTLIMEQYQFSVQSAEVLQILLQQVKHSTNLQYLNINLKTCTFDENMLIGILNFSFNQFILLQELSIDLSYQKSIIIPSDCQCNGIRRLYINLSGTQQTNQSVESLFKFINQQSALMTLSVNFSECYLSHLISFQILNNIYKLNIANISLDLGRNTFIDFTLNSNMVALDRYNINLNDSILLSLTYEKSIPYQLLNYLTINHLSLNLNNTLMHDINTVKLLANKIHKLNCISLTLSVVNCRLSPTSIIQFLQIISSSRRLLQLQIDLRYNCICKHSQKMIVCSLLQLNLLHLHIVFPTYKRYRMLESYVCYNSNMLSCNLVKSRLTREYLRTKLRIVHLIRKARQLQIDDYLDDIISIF